MASPRALMILSENDTLVGPRDLTALVDMAVAAEAAGIDGVMLSEHIVLGPAAGALGRPANPRDYAAPGNQDPAFPWPSSLVLLSAMAARTTTLRLAAAAVIFPLRHPLLLARELGTLDLLSGGRLVVLPTVSWHEEEYQSLGVDFRRRGRILDEQLAIWQRIWQPGPTTFHGEFFDIDEAYLEPRAFRDRGPSLWIGGSSVHGKVAQRLAAYGHGFNPFGSVTAADLDVLRAAVESQGREWNDIELVGGVRAALPPGDARGGLEQAMEAVPAQVEMGFSTICVKPGMFIDSVDEFPDFCREVVARLSEMSVPRIS